MNRKVLADILAFSPDNILPIRLDADLTAQEKDIFLDRFLREQYVRTGLRDGTVFEFRWTHKNIDGTPLVRLLCLAGGARMIGITDTMLKDTHAEISYGFEPGYMFLKEEEAIPLITQGPCNDNEAYFGGYPVAIYTHPDYSKKYRGIARTMLALTAHTVRHLGLRSHITGVDLFSPRSQALFEGLMALNPDHEGHISLRDDAVLPPIKIEPR